MIMPLQSVFMLILQLASALSVIVNLPKYYFQGKFGRCKSDMLASKINLPEVYSIVFFLYILRRFSKPFYIQRSVLFP